ncbi:MAG TPA: NifU family protein [Micromonosporaceae bacterium]|nr:NifU family protein [Micromonosporaceae bacterium]
MPQHNNVRAAGERVEGLIGELRSQPDPRVAEVAEELVRTLVDLYGEGLAHVMHVAQSVGDESPREHDGGATNASERDGGATSGRAGEPNRIVEQLVADPLVASLLLVHDLHPVDVDTRIQRALDDVRPYLGSHAGGVEYLGVDDDGVVRLKLEGSCHGCPSSTVTVRLAIEKAIEEAAPETVRVEVAGVVAEQSAPALLQIGRRVPEPTTPTEPEGSTARGGSMPTAAKAVAAVEPDGWAHLPSWPPGGSDARPVMVADVPVLVCRVGGAMFAYRDSCPECTASLSGGHLVGESLQCASCGRRYDVRLAGAGLDDPRRHLEPLPLLQDADGLRIAIGMPAGSRA